MERFSSHTPIFDPPIQRKDGGTVSKIIKIIKTLMGIFKKPAEETGKADSVNDNSSIENIDKLTQVFSNFKNDVHEKAVEVEAAVIEEVDFYVQELSELLDENADKVKKYGIRMKRVERQIDRISSEINGTIDNELSKSVSLDNSECREIIKMIPGSKKESAMNEFLSKSVRNALDICCKEVHSTLADIYDDVEEEVLGTIDGIQKQNEKLQSDFSSIDENNYAETAKQKMVDAYYTIDVCDMVEGVL